MSFHRIKERTGEPVLIEPRPGAAGKLEQRPEVGEDVINRRFDGPDSDDRPGAGLRD